MHCLKWLRYTVHGDIRIHSSHESKEVWEKVMEFSMNLQLQFSQAMLIM
jgi:hypothetical protein